MPLEPEPAAPARPGLGPTVALACALTLPACGGEPPEGLAGFELGMSQAEVAARAGELGAFTCRYRGTRPTMMTCEGPDDGGQVRVVVVSDTARAISIDMDPGGEDPQRAMRRAVDGFGDPAWRERPHPGGPGAGPGYHTLWLDEDSTRAASALCAGQALQPPCTLELATTSPAAILATLDSLLGIPANARRGRR